MTEIHAPDVPALNRLADFPVAFFSVVMGLCGLTLTLAMMEKAFLLPARASHTMLVITVIVFVVIAVIYGCKLIRHPQSVKSEWSHPIRIAFFPAISISLLLIAIAVMPILPSLSRIIWISGTTAQGVLTLSVIANWIGHRTFQPIHLNPAWFIPAVGNVIVPIAGVRLGFVEISWLFFSGGLIFWIILLTLVVNRLIFHEPLPGRLFPTLVILIAPPAVAFIAYVQLTGTIDPFARFLLNAGYVFAAIVLTQLPKLLRLPFVLSWWALSFPVAALAIASFVFAESTGSSVHLVIGTVLFILLAVVVTGLVLRTTFAIYRKEICRPE